MDKNINSSSNANKDTFKNTPHAQGGSASKSTDISAGNAMDTVNDMKNTIMDKAAPAVDYMKSNFSNVSDMTQDYVKSAGSIVRQYPFYSLLGAVALGAFVGMAIARPSSKNA